MSRAKLIRRLDELEALLRRGYASAERRFLEGLSDEELDALYLELGGEREAEPAQRPEPAYRVVTSRSVEEAVSEELLLALPEPNKIEEAPEPAPSPPDPDEVKIEPPATAPQPMVLRSCDYVPRSPWAGPPVERAESEEVAFREKPLERVYTAFGPSRRRRSRRG